MAMPDGMRETSHPTSKFVESREGDTLPLTNGLLVDGEGVKAALDKLEGHFSQVDESRHDIESIQIYISKQNEASISTEQVRLLRELQRVYRRRMVGPESGYYCG
jgi:hypothetical protein